MKILVLNSGSSSQKSCLYDIDSLPEHPPNPVWEAKIEWSESTADIQVKTSEGSKFSDQVKVASRRQALEHLFRSLWEGNAPIVEKPSEVRVVGHRIVLGGHKFEEPVIVTDEVKRAIASVSGFAPLHNRAELEGIEIIEHLLKRVPQVAVFDTAFHHRMPLAAAVYPGPYEWIEQGIRRYGFHGINHQYCAQRAAELLGKQLNSLRLVSCHLGNGCSLAAIHRGRSVDTTMGFTPLDGLMMGTRSGSVDPGILTYLMQQKRTDGRRLDELLNNEAGLLGISGVSSDMREILKAKESGNQRAKLAFDIFIHRLRSGIGSMVAVLGGLDALIFTAGIGENSEVVRQAACSDFGYLHLELDPLRNHPSPVDHDIAANDSAVRVLIIHAQEDWAIARECWRMVSKSNASGGPASEALNEDALSQRSRIEPHTTVHQ
ncbi:MAG TPA: acetate kinase [Candidatus Sulfotelmatobacter sp.]|nr:acetate kinase [Candidatus Sulfotelmatobacter sp.]